MNPFFPVFIGVAGQDRFEVALHRCEAVAAERVDVSGHRIRGDLRRAHRGHSGVDPCREGVVEPDRGVLAEHRHGLLQPLVRSVEGRQRDPHPVRQDLLMREHRREAVLGVDDEGGAAGERTGEVLALRVQPELGEAGVARGEERGDVRVVGETPRLTGGVGVAAGLGHAVPIDRADGAEHARGLAVGLGHLAVRVRVADEGRADGHAQLAVAQVHGADEDGRVEVVPAVGVGREERRDARVVAPGLALVPPDHGAGVLHGGAGDGRGEHRLAEDVPRVQPAPSAQHVLGVGQPRHLLEMRARDASAVGADGAHHLELLVHDHEQLLGLLGRRQEVGERLLRRAAGRMPEGARDGVHGDDAAAGHDVRLGARPDRDVPGGDDRERPVGAALVGEQSPEPGERRLALIGVDGRGEIAADDEVRTLAAADLVRDHCLDDPRVLLVRDVEALIAERDRGGRKRVEHSSGRQVEVLRDDEAAQRGAVVLGHEAALADLSIRDEREHLPRLSLDRQGDVGEQVDVGHFSGEQLDGVRAVPGDQHEGRGGVGAELVEAREGHRCLLCEGSGSAQRKDRPGGGLDSREREHTA
ncbi:unnamed protein product [Penicillium discolor]